MAKKPTMKSVETLKHDDATRKNIPTAEHQSIMLDADKNPIKVAYERRNRDLDPQLVWRGKDEQDWSDLVVQAPPLYIQEKVHPKVLIDDLLRRTKAKEKADDSQFDLFADFNGLPNEEAKTEFYQHDAHWANRMILGDSLQVMASLAEREGLRGKVQCIFIDPPYGIKFNSNFQWSTTDRDVKDGKIDHITREPEQVKAFRDTWRDGIHSYMTYLRDRLTVARDLLSDSGSVFVQIGDENVHRVRALLDEVFGEDNFVTTISFQKTSYATADHIPNLFDMAILYAKDLKKLKFRKLYVDRDFDDEDSYESRDMASAGAGASTFDFQFRGKAYHPGKNRHWKTQITGLERAVKADRLFPTKNSLRYKRYNRDFSVTELHNTWTDTMVGSFHEPRRYVVETSPKVVQRCLLMVTDPGDLVLDPTCGSGTTAYVSEQWGRRWITIDTSRVALALARARIMGARYPYYILGDSPEGQKKEAKITRCIPSTKPTLGDIRHGFVCERVPHITLKDIANNTEVDVIWERCQENIEQLRQKLNKSLDKSWTEWEIPHNAEDKWSDVVKELHAEWWQQWVYRQKEIDASIAAKAEFEDLYDKPFEDKKKVRVAGPFTVESLSPHRVLGVDENDELIDSVAESQDEFRGEQGFVQMLLENLKTAGVQQAHKEDKIDFTSLVPWPGDLICAEGRYEDADGEKRTAIFIGPEFGTVSRPDLVSAAREAGDAGFDVLISCAFNYDAHSSEFDKLGRIPVLKARMNADLHMADDLKNTGKGNLFVIFGEPDIDILDAEDGQIQVKVNGVDVFHPNTGEVRSDGADGIACWFIDTDYNEESFFVRHAYFLGANDPYKALKTTLKAEINQEAWDTLHSDTSRPFAKPSTGRIAVKVINHLGDEVMKVFRV